MNTRPPLDEYFINITREVGKRSTCIRHQIGCIAVRDKQILTTGYNGAPSGMKDCIELGCLRDQEKIPSGKNTEVCRAIHAEQNVIIQAALHGISLEGSTIYCIYSPCILCAKMLVNAKISRHVYLLDYADKGFIELYKEVEIKFDKLGIDN